MFIKKKDYEEMVRKHEERVDHYFREACSYEADVECLHKGIIRALIYLKRIEQNEDVLTAIDRLVSAYKITNGDEEVLDEFFYGNSSG